MTKGRNVFAYQTRSKSKLISVSPVVGDFGLPLLGYPEHAKFALHPLCQNNN